MASQYKKFFELRLPALILSMALAATLNVAFAKVNVGSDGVAIHGYDAVAYFLEGRAAQGTTEFEHSWQDAKWRFSSEANKNLFIADPKRYAPQYGGFCAVCLALDSELTDANPKAWTIVDGKLYLNYSMHQRTQWRIRSDLYVKYGDGEWAKVAVQEEKSSSADGSYRIGVITPAFFYPVAPTPNPQVIGELGGDIYEAILQQPSFSISKADEPSDPSALGFLNRGGDWPFPPTTVKPSEAWNGEKNNRKPNLERLYRVAQEQDLDAVVAWFYKPLWDHPQWPVEVYVIDIKKQRVYLREGLNVKAGELVRQALDDFLAGREGYRIAVMNPRGGQDTRQLLLGGEIYEKVLQQSQISISYADEPDDPSARAFLNRGGKWPYPSTNMDPNEVWKGAKIRMDDTPNVEKLYPAGEKLAVDALILWKFDQNQFYADWPVTIFLVDVQRKQVYEHQGTYLHLGQLVQNAFDDFRVGREGYRIAVLDPGFNYAGRPWGVGTSSIEETFLGIGGEIYRAIQKQSSISISFADEPPDPSARSEVNRGGDWPFPETSVDRKAAWEWETGKQQYMTPNFEQVYQAGRELGVDGVVMYYFKPVWRMIQWPVDVYVIDIEQQRVYAHKGTNTEASELVARAFGEFVAGRKQ